MPAEQPSAPYLDAVVAYGTARARSLPRARPQGRPGRRPGPCASASAPRARARHPAGHLGRRPRPVEPTPYDEAERLAAEAHGAARTFFLTNGATQGNHALCLGLRRRAPTSWCSATRTRRWSTDWFSRGGIPAFVAPAYDVELGMANGVEPAALERALAAVPGGARCVHRLADLLRHDRRGGGLRRGRPRGRRRARRRRVLGPALRLPRGRARERAGARGRRRAHLDEQDRRCADAGRDAARRPTRPRRRGAGPRGRSAWCARRRPRSLLLASLDGARRQLALHGEQAAPRDPPRRSTRRGPRSVEFRYRAGGPCLSETTAPTRCASCSTSAPAGAAPATRWSTPLRRSYDVNVELATQATIVFLVGLGERPETLRRLAGDVEEVAKRISRAGEHVQRDRAPPATISRR